MRAVAQNVVVPATAPAASAQTSASPQDSR
jgi:hypothetical protein